jgi:hypothetical protein
LDQKFFGFGEGLLRVGGEIEVEGVGVPIQRLVALSRSRTGKPCLENQRLVIQVKTDTKILLPTLAVRVSGVARRGFSWSETWRPFRFFHSFDFKNIDIPLPALALDG